MFLESWRKALQVSETKAALEKMCIEGIESCPMIAFFERACTPLSGAGKHFWRQADK